MFRDESARTIEKARRDNQLDSLDVVNIRLEGSELPVQSPAAQRAETGVPFLAPPLARPLQRPLGQMAADFFFNNFVFEGPLLSDNNSHLTMSIYRDHSQSAAFDAIEAVGLAGLSNVLRDRHLRYEAQRRYGRALTKTNGLLGDPDEARSDLTAMSILLLGQFESMTVESWDQYDRLVVHVEGASALIKLRGEKQFERESGVRLYFALRFQIVRARVLPHLLPFWPVQLLVDLLTGYHDYQLTDCMQRELPVPDSLLEAGKALQNSPVKRPRSSRTSMGDVYVRYVNIIAAMKATWPPDRQLLLEEINVLEKALQEWRLGIYPDCDFTTVQGAGFTDGDKCDMPSADGRRHVYKVRWSAHVWNKWRIMRMMIYRLKLDYGMVDDRQQCETAIREASMDICLSVPSLLASSREFYTLTFYSSSRHVYSLIFYDYRRTDLDLAAIHGLSRGPKVRVLTVPIPPLPQASLSRPEPLTVE